MTEQMTPIPEAGSGRREQKKESPGWARLAVASMVCAVAALGLSATALWMTMPRQEEAPPAPVEAEESSAAPVTEYLTYKNHQLPIETALPVNGWTEGDFSRDEQGWLRGGDALTGVDVSAHQGEIDWQKVADSGVDFAIIRAGYRGYGQEGKLLQDENFEQNIRGALNAGLDVGVYFFSQATNVWEVEEEAQQLLKALEGYPITYPVVFDWERITHSAARTDGVKGKTVTLMAQAFCGMVAQAGYTPGVYFNQDMGYLELDLDRLKDCVFWLAEYDDSPGFYYDFDLWQYTSKGTVPGISTPVDMNLAFRDFGASKETEKEG